MNECDIFMDALDKPLDEREAYLEQVCGGSRELRQRMDLLLASHGQAGSLMEHPPVSDATPTVAPDQCEVSTRDVASESEIQLDFLAPYADPTALGRLGPYVVTGVIGRGGMGLVLKAHDAKLNRVVAIKMMAPELASNPTARKRFIREAQAAAAVVHQHIVTIHAVDEDRFPYLVMEYIDGQSLQEKIDREGHLELKEILRIGQQVAAGLAAAHAHGLMHRDVKPANILLENGVERVRITDFGLARAVDDVGMTKTGDVAGTPQYMSPEQALGQAIDHRSDLFSLGSVLYAMCTGRSPFRAETVVAALRRVCDDTPRPIREVNPEIPQWLVTIIDRLLAKEPDDRIQTAAEVAELLGQCLAQVQHPASPTLREASAPQSKIQNPKSKNRSPWAIAVAAAIVFLLLGISLTEATGVTHVVPTVIRIVTGEGTLVVETDPDVHVALEGNGDLTFNLAGGQTIRVPSGRYHVKATKVGQPISLEREVVRINKGDRQVVRVKLEAPSPGPTAGKDPPPSAIAPFDAATAKEHQEAWAKHLGVPIEFTNSIGMKFRLIPPGEFEMGSTSQDIEAGRAAEKYSDDQAMSDALSSEGPIHRVVLSEPFYLSATEVTQKDFETVTGENPSTFRLGGENAEKVRDTDAAQLPVQGTSWNDAANFCSRLSLRDGLASNYRPVGSAVEMLPGNGYRLPCEAQWEFACRAGTTTRFWFGNDPGDHSNREWLASNSAGRPHPVGSLAKNPFGLFDMLGNVSEWVQDGWNPEFYLLSKDRPAVDPLSKPKGPHQHMVRGGAWTSQPAVRGRSAFRMPAVPSRRYELNGLRVMLSVNSAGQVIERQRSIASRSEPGAFVLVGGGGERQFDTLAEAVQRASDGDTIEIRGNGPFISEPISIQRTALMIRAAAGFRPVLKLSAGASRQKGTFLTANAALVLEGLELHRAPPEDWASGEFSAVGTNDAPLWAANCRFHAPVWANRSSVCEFRNCEFLTEKGGSAAARLRTSGKLILENCLHRITAFPIGFELEDAAMHDASIQIKRNSFASQGASLRLVLRTPWPGPSGPPQESKPIRIDISDSIFDAPSALGFEQTRQFLDNVAVLEPAEAEATMLRLLQWRGERNLFAAGSTSVSWRADLKPQTSHGPKSLEEWRQFWGAAEAASLPGTIRFQGGNLRSLTGSAIDQLTPDDFRLRADSAGYRAGPDGKDLGADVDLVGPGPAYERWRKTPEYQEWLKETRQMK